MNLIELQDTLRLSFFLGIFVIMAAWELRAPFRSARFSRRQRWPHQLALVVVDSLVLRLLLPTAAIGSAQLAASESYGLSHWFSLPALVAIPLGFLLLDFFIYWQHVLTHKIHWLWRLHRCHHADTDFDLTTGIRFHPLEILFSMTIKIALISLLGIPVIAVLLFEIILNGSALFNHANVQLPKAIDSTLRKLIVTPDMHRIHHSTHNIEHDSNFGFFLSIWDHWFGSYRSRAEENQQHAQIGLKRFRDKTDISLKQILLMPFR